MVAGYVFSPKSTNSKASKQLCISLRLFVRNDSILSCQTWRIPCAREVFFQSKFKGFGSSLANGEDGARVDMAL
jgi:hypothetical protein